MTTPIPDLLAASCRAFALQLKPFGVSDVLSDAADLIQHQQATIERLSAALEYAKGYLAGVHEFAALAEVQAIALGKDASDE